MVKFEFHGKTLHLLFNGNLMFDLQETYGKDSSVFTLCKPNTKEAFNNACQIITLMCEQGELLRRYMGHDAEETPDAEWFSMLSSYADVMRIKTAVFCTATHDVDSNIIEEEVDLGLLEIESKEKKKLTKPSKPISAAE